MDVNISMGCMLIAIGLFVLLVTSGAEMGVVVGLGLVFAGVLSGVVEKGRK